MSAVVDTDVFSFVFKRDSRRQLYEPHLDGRFLFVSFMTVAELGLWPLIGNWGDKKKKQLNDSLKRYSICHSSTELCLLWAEIKHKSRVSGKPIATADAWIAATAILLDLPLITHNTDDLAGVTGLTLISEKE